MKNNGNGHIEILIAEDSPTQAAQLRQLLEEHKYKVRTAVNGKDALAKLAEHRSALVISDVMMPELDGYGLCLAIKTDDKLKHIPVMLVTNLSDPGDVIRGLECGADNFIRKPYEEKYLVSRIDYLLMNVELRKNQRMQLAMEIDIGGKKHFISAERQQILDLLVSTYEQAVQVNSELKQREKDLTHSNQVLQGLSRISAGLNSAVDEREVAEKALQYALELPGVQAGWIFLRTGETGFRLAAARGLPPALCEPGVFEQDCACRRMLVKGELNSVTNIIECERLVSVKGETRGLRCHASVPLWLGEERLLGVMNLAGTGKGVFNDSQLKVLHGIGNQVAVALERAQLHAHLETLVAERTAKLSQEIKERRRVEEEQARLVSIINATPDFVGRADLAGHPIFINQAGLRMLGLDPERGRLPSHIAEAHPDWATKRIQEEGVPFAIEHGAWSGETELLRRDGTAIPVSQVIIAHRSANGDVEFLSTVMRDITPHRKAEEALQDSRENLDRILNSIAEGAYGVDVNGLCTFVNRAFLEILGYQDAQELLGQDIHHLIHHSHADGSAYPFSECRMALAYRSNQAINVSDEVFWRKDGEPIPVEYWSHPIVNKGKVTGAITTFIDISERKRAEAELLQLNESLEQKVTDRTADLERSRREADDANRSKSAFLSTMSHEIRTPMNGVVGLVDVLAQSRLSEHQADLVKTIRQSANTLLGIIDDILDFSKIEAGRLELERVPVSVQDLVEGLCNSLLPVASRKGVRLFTFVSPGIPERVLSDDTRLRQVLYNLVGNAIKFSGRTPGRRGQVSVRVEPVQAVPLRLAFRVTDNGIGMAPETLEHLFTPFTQAEVSTTRRFGGTGLGLAISKRLVDLMQGEISVTSVLGQGSTFTLTLDFEVPDTQPVRRFPDLAGLDCIVLESPAFHANDWRAYLEASGARAQLASDVSSVARLAMQCPAPVVVAQAAESAELPPALGSALAPLPDIRCLLITHGRSRASRIEGPHTVSVDGDALRRLTLLRAVSVAAGRAPPEIFHEKQEERLANTVAPPTIDEARAQGRLILVAEDDEINQKVILHQLGLLGYAAEVAVNGVDALRLWQQGRHALLLTDLHMPEMDGYKLAETIRLEESGRRHIPIVLLTANALRGEANRAYAAGIDDYLTKPVQLHLLRASLEKWLPSVTGNNALNVSPAPNNAPPLTSGVDVSVLEALVGHDQATVHEFLGDYLSSARYLAATMRSALAAGDMPPLVVAAHKLKSSSRSVGAMALGDVCAELEKLGKEENRKNVDLCMVRFASSLAQVEAEISALLGEP